MVKYRLFYFPARGRAEVIRLLFAASGVDFEDIRVQGEEWQRLKSDMPMGQMPVLEVDGVKMAQSGAIARYLAKTFNLGGKTDLEAYWADLYIDTFEDIGKKYPFFEKDETKKEELKKKFFEEIVPEGLKNVEKLYSEYNKGKDCFLVGDLTVADLAFITLLDWVLPMDPKVLDCLPLLADLSKRVREIPKIKAWLESRPKSQF